MADDYLLTAGIAKNFDPGGHYARPDVTQLSVNRLRQSTIKLFEGDQ